MAQHTRATVVLVDTDTRRHDTRCHPLLSLSARASPRYIRNTHSALLAQHVRTHSAHSAARSRAELDESGRGATPHEPRSPARLTPFLHSNVALSTPSQRQAPPLIRRSTSSRPSASFAAARCAALSAARSPRPPAPSPCPVHPPRSRGQERRDPCARPHRAPCLDAATPSAHLSPHAPNSPSGGHAPCVPSRLPPRHPLPSHAPPARDEKRGSALPAARSIGCTPRGRRDRRAVKLRRGGGVWARLMLALSAALLTCRAPSTTTTTARCRGSRCDS